MSQKPARKRKLPTKLWLSPNFFIKVELRPGEDIQGDDGEWVTNLPPTKGIAGIMRVDKSQDEHELWKTFRHELFHALVDIHEWIASHPEDEEDPEEGKNGNTGTDSSSTKSDSDGGVRADGPQVGTGDR